ncbi:MAG: restriction endonuclease subunit S [Xenococcaceae cyanobacterium MO_167.B27]|nr:restriction endonuclease subunit S [Xenococcaceae cyanobacterium MO_167.B27]
MIYRLKPASIHTKSAYADYKNKGGLKIGFSIRGLEGIETLFLIHLIRTFESQISQKGTGTTFKAISGNILRNLEFPLPPLNEQKRIVAKIEALQTRSQRVKQELEAIKPLLEQFRQSVLAAAFRGDLTKDWREQNPDVEPAEVLFKDSDDLVISNKSIPKTWIHIKLNSLINKIQAGKNFKCPEIPVNQDRVGLVKISAVTWGRFNPQETKTVDDKSQINPDLFINKGDFLVSRANTIELVGASVIVEEINYQIMISDKVWRIVTNEQANKKYIDFFLKSKRGRKEIETRATGNQQSMRNISQKAFKDVVIPFAPLPEQKEIVRRIESLFKLADNIEQQYQQAEIDLETLNQSILAKAFRGELVPQDPNDEPASVLLKRIRKEREKQKAAKKSKKK